MNLIESASEIFDDLCLVYDNLPHNESTQELRSRITLWMQRAARGCDWLDDAQEVVERIIRTNDRKKRPDSDYYLIRVWCLTLLDFFAKQRGDREEPFRTTPRPQVLRDSNIP